ncbi:MAG: (Fe-S)-binding protein [Solirubrobacteraceae bacterium]
MTAFDAIHPPEQALVDDCVHCGFCLDSCPTYVLWAQEADSPRGRIVLIDEALNNGGTLSDELVSHFDSCLGCMACVTACPSGVQYDRLIERVRPQIERNHQRSNAERALRLLLFETLPYPRRLRALVPALAAARRLGIERRLPERLAVLTKVAPRTVGRRAPSFSPPLVTPARGVQRGRVGLLLGCVQRVFFSGVHEATIEVLSAEGYEVVSPVLPDCCGALELHAGEEEPALARARATIAAFGEVGELDAIIVNAAGCGAAMKEYGFLLETPEAEAFSAIVADVSEFLAGVEPRAERGAVPLKVVYHDACHLAHAQGIRSAPRELLEAIPGLSVLEVAAEPDVCCGSAGIYNIVQPRAAAELGERKAKNLLASGAEAIAAGNPGCTAQLDLHLRELGRRLPIFHPIELLARSLAAGSQ